MRNYWCVVCHAQLFVGDSWCAISYAQSLFVLLPTKYVFTKNAEKFTDIISFYFSSTTVIVKHSLCHVRQLQYTNLQNINCHNFFTILLQW